MQIHELTKRNISEADTVGQGGATDGAFGATGFQSGGLLDRLKRTAAAVKQSGGVKAAAKSLSNKVQVPGAEPGKKRSAWTNTAALTQSPFMQAYRGGIGSVQPTQPQTTAPAAPATAQPPRGAGMPPGAGFQTDLGLKGLTRQKAEDVGEYLQRVSGSNTVKNTGNAHVNEMLKLMGFEVK